MSDRSYSAGDIQVLTGLEPIRRRPGMYIGDVTDGTGLHHMLWEILDHAVESHREGTATRIDVTIAGHLVSVADDGDGLSIETVPGADITVMEAMVSRLFCGQRRSGLHGVGLAAVNALSDRFDIEVTRGTGTYSIGYARGNRTRPFTASATNGHTGTRISFDPDFSIFRRQPWDLALIGARLHDLAGLNPGLILTLNGRRYCCPDGLSDLVRLAANEPDGEPIRLYEDHADQLTIEVALLWTDKPESDVRGFVNQHASHGVHVECLRWGIVEAVRGLEDRLVRVNAPALFEVIAPGLVAAIAIELDSPCFATQARTWLDNPEVGIAVQSTIAACVGEALARDHALRDRLLARLPR